VEGTGETGVHYFSSETCSGVLLHMPRKQEMRMHNTARTKGAFYGKQIIHKIHTHCVRLSLSTRNAILFYANHTLSHV